ncbi:MAG: circadian clock protein LdpA [Spirulinaceae cyanobacterium]
MIRSSPLHSLQTGQWFKLICGASFQDLPTIRNLVLTYALAGADCVDVAADPAVVRATQVALTVADQLPSQTSRPWLMVSLNDGLDPHFRKAQFDPSQCPTNCPRPCEAICPTEAIALPAGVNAARCYGCGRCWPVCPEGLIREQPYVSTPSVVIPLVLDSGIEAIEIHTQVGNLSGFQRLWQVLAPQVERLQAIAISCPDHPELIAYLQSLLSVMGDLPCPLIWQTDGRPMSGDLGRGTTHAAVRLAQKVLAAGLPGAVQLAGGTNAHTVPKLRELGLLPQPAQATQRTVAGVAYGGAARQHLLPLWQQLTQRGSERLEDHPDLLQAAIAQAQSLVQPLKRSPVSAPPSEALTVLSAP